MHHCLKVHDILLCKKSSICQRSNEIQYNNSTIRNFSSLQNVLIHYQVVISLFNKITVYFIALILKKKSKTIFKIMPYL